MAKHPRDETLTYRPSRSDRGAMWLLVAAGAAIAIVSVIGAIVRIVEILPNTDVRVPAEFVGTVAQAPIGVDGAPVDVTLDRAFLTVDALPIASLWSLVIAQIVGALAVIVVVTCLVVLSTSVSRGRVFSRGNTALVATAGITALLGVTGVPFFSNMAANGAFAHISDGSFSNVIMSVDLQSYILLAFAVAMVSAVFSIGDRMRRDTEGLV